MHKEFEHLPQTLQPKVEAYAEAVAQKVANVCKRNGIAKTTAAAFMADNIDMLAGIYKPFHATFEQMREVVTKSKFGTWERTGMPTLAMAAVYYARIVEAQEQDEYTHLNNYIDAAVTCYIRQLNGIAVTDKNIQKRQSFRRNNCPICCPVTYRRTNRSANRVCPW